MFPSLYISHGSPMLALEPGASGPALARLAAPPAVFIIIDKGFDTGRAALRVTGIGVCSAQGSDR